MIVVVDDHGQEWPFTEAEKFRTDDPLNNLMVYTDGGELVGLFAEGKWVGVRVAED